MRYNYIVMNKNYSILVSITLVGITLFMCGKKMAFLSDTFLGRVIVVLTIIGLTLVNKNYGIAAAVLFTMLYKTTEYKEGLVTKPERTNELGDYMGYNSPDSFEEETYTAAPPDGGASSTSAFITADAASSKDDEEE